MKKLSRPQQCGFTLIEIMVVVAILGLLATLITPSAISSHQSAEWDKARVDVGALKDTVELYLIRNAGPDLPTWEDLITPDARGQVWLKGFTRAPVDPYGNEYVLRPGPGGTTDFEVVCWGPDGQADTEDDISSRSLRDS